MFVNYFVILTCVVFTNCKSLPPNNTAVLISKYAKVAHWGAAPTTTTERTYSEGRSHSGQSLWTHRSDVNIASGQDLKKQSITYQYPIKKDSTNHNEKIPGVGEVIQDRFNPPPFFNYGYDKSPNQQNDNFPVYNPPSPPDSPPIDKPSGGSDIIPYSPDNDDNAPPPPPPPRPSPPSGDYSYTPPKPSNNGVKNYPSLGPPLAPHDDDVDDDTGADNGHDNDNIYYPPSNQPEIILDHPPPGYKDHGSTGSGKGNNGGNMAEHDLVPPPSNGGGTNGGYDEQFPQYLYNEPHGNDYGGPLYDHHHVYKEITTTEEPEERVNKAQYSYYYLGRKLWYLPLYFSLYFIVYVFVLILKAIARHKVNFKHDLHDVISGNARNARILNDDSVKIDQIHNNVTTAIDQTRKRFVYVAM